MKPEPKALVFISRPGPSRGPPKNLSKKSNGSCGSPPKGALRRVLDCSLMIDSVLIFTTAGSTVLAIFENSEESCDGEGMAIAAAPGLTPGRSAFTDLLITVPMTTPTAKVAIIKQKKSNLRFLIVSIILSRTFFTFSIPSSTEIFKLLKARIVPKRCADRKSLFQWYLSVTELKGCVA